MSVDISLPLLGHSFPAPLVYLLSHTLRRYTRGLCHVYTQVIIPNHPLASISGSELTSKLPKDQERNPGQGPTEYTCVITNKNVPLIQTVTD